MIQQLLNPESVLCHAEARSKKHCLEILSELLAHSNPDGAKDDIFARLIERERLGCTCLDKGIAFPHCRVNGVKSESAALLTLSTAVEFDSPDGELVDVVFGLMVPEELDAANYSTIETVTGFLTSDRLRTRLRAARSNSELYDALRAAQADDARPKAARGG